MPKLKRLSIFLTVTFLCISCTKNISKENTQIDVEEKSIPINNIHVAFAGGGWRAHTAHTAWTISLLEDNGHKLDNVFKNVESIGSNSGGSWFSTMLMYSQKFVSEIEKNTIDTWGNTKGNGGWLGVQQNLFDSATFLGLSCQDVSGGAFSTCVLESYSEKNINWASAVENLVYNNYLNIKTTLSDKRQSWATEKSLLLAATMLTSNVVLNEEDLFEEHAKRYYQACLSSKPKLNGYNQSTCDNGVTTNVTPVTFSSIGKSKNLNIKTPPFLPAAGTGVDKLKFKIGYTNNFKSGWKERNNHFQNPLKNDNVQVIHAAAASSAALGFAASDNISGYWEASYEAQNLAPAFSFANSTVTFKSPYEMTIDHLRDSIMVRLADGGAVDNSGVAQLVSFLQLNSKDNEFNIVAFDNVQEQPFLSGNHNTAVGNDIAMLFGYGLCQGNNFCSGCNCSGACINVPELQIFESKTIETPITWSFQTEKDKQSKYIDLPKLIYTKYSVTTTDNTSFGIKSGSKGTLHAFTCVYPEAATIPKNYGKDKSFKAYNDMMKFINTGLKVNNNEGLLYLEKALGIK